MGIRLENHAEVVERLRLQISRIGGAATSAAWKQDQSRTPIRFGLETIDSRLPRGGLAAGALHEVLGHGPDTEHGTLASLLVSGLLARAEAGAEPGASHGGQVLWAMQRNDLFAPGLAAVGLHPQRLILAECGGSVLAVMEEALRHPGLVAVVGEVEGKLGLTASRRLQLAAEASGVTAFAIRRSRRFDDPVLLAPSAAVSRWRVSAVPEAVSPGSSLQSLEAFPGRALWRLELLRCREASPFHWIVQACDAQGHLADAYPVAAASHARAPGRPTTPDRLSVVAALADGPAQARAHSPGQLRLA